MTDSVAANVLGTIGTVFWCIQLIPQIISNYRKKNCEGLPPLMFLLWTLCGVPFSIYFISIGSNIPVQVQPQCFTVLCLITFCQTLYYPPISKPKKQVIIVAIAIALLAAACECACIIPFQRLYRRGITWPPLIFGILASIALALGLVPPYFELWKRKGRVIGINFFFLAMDLSGALFSLASLAVSKEEVDIMGCVLYSICAILEIGIFVSHFVWMLFIRPRMPEQCTDITPCQSQETIEEERYSEREK